MSKYTEYKDHIIECPFCDKNINVYYSKQHINLNFVKNSKLIQMN